MNARNDQTFGPKPLDAQAALVSSGHDLQTPSSGPVPPLMCAVRWSVVAFGAVVLLVIGAALAGLL